MNASFRCNYQKMLKLIFRRLTCSARGHCINDVKESSQLVSEHLVAQLIEQHPELLSRLSALCSPIDKQTFSIASGFNPSSLSQPIKNRLQRLFHASLLLWTKIVALAHDGEKAAAREARASSLESPYPTDRN